MRQQRAGRVALAVVERPAQRVARDRGRRDVRLVGGEVVEDGVAPGRLGAARVREQGEPQWKYWPPSMTMVWPVTNADPGPQRNTTAPTTSSGTWSRLSVRAETRHVAQRVDDLGVLAHAGAHREPRAPRS